MASNENTGSSKNKRDSISSALGDTSSPAELSLVVDELINSLSNKFAGVSSEIFAKMDDMSRRLDNLDSLLNSTENQSPSK